MLAKITIGLYVAKFSGNFSILTLLDLPEQLASLTNPPSWNTPTYLAAPSVFLLSPPPPVYLSMLNFHRDWFCTLISRWAHLDLPFPTDLFAACKTKAKTKQEQSTPKLQENQRQHPRCNSWGKGGGTGVCKLGTGEESQKSVVAWKPKGEKASRRNKCQLLAVFTDAQEDDCKTVTEIL